MADLDMVMLGGSRTRPIGALLICEGTISGLTLVGCVAADCPQTSAVVAS